MGSSKPAVSGALVDINILQINVNAHHAPARQEDSINASAEGWKSQSSEGSEGYHTIKACFGGIKY